MKKNLSVQFDLEGPNEADILELTDIIHRFPQIAERVISLRHRSPVELQVDSVFATGADRVCIRLKPSESLSELMSAARAFKVEGLV